MMLMIQLSPDIQNFITLFLSIIIESLPFVLLGVVVSVLVALFVSESFILKILPKNRILSHMVLSLCGILIPVCQCGNIPVARRLIMQRLSVSQATTFLIASPVINPITFITTLQAFSSQPEIAVLRLVIVFIIANGIGIFISYQKNQEIFLNKAFNDTCRNEPVHCRSYSYALDVFRSDFILIMKMLCIGAFIAAGTQEFIPKTTLLSIGSSSVLSIFSMLALGFIISICSTVDAFFALSYASNFTVGSLLAFLIFSPLVDIKMIALMKTMYTTSFIIKISLIIALASIVTGLVINGSTGL